MGERAELPEWLRQIAGEVHDLSRTSRNRAEFQRAIREVAERCCPMREEDRPTTPSPFQLENGGIAGTGKSTEVLRDGLTIADKLFVMAVIRDHFLATDRLDPFDWPESLTIDESDGTAPQSAEDLAAVREMRFALWYVSHYDSRIAPIVRSGEEVVAGFLMDVRGHLDSLSRKEAIEIDDDSLTSEFSTHYPILVNTDIGVISREGLTRTIGVQPSKVISGFVAHGGTLSHRSVESVYREAGYTGKYPSAFKTFISSTLNPVLQSLSCEIESYNGGYQLKFWELTELANRKESVSPE